MNEEIRSLLEEIQEWMVENDYECGNWGSDIYRNISSLLKKYDNDTKS